MQWLMSFFVLVGGLSVHAMDYEAWRKENEGRLRSEKGWLTVVGLHWLKEGKNTLGSDFKNDLRLPKSAPAEVGHIEKVGDKYTLHINDKIDMKVDGKRPAATSVPLATDQDGKADPTKLELGKLEFFLIARKNGVGLRVKDPDSEARKNFKGKRWFNVNKNMVMEADWVAKPKKIVIPDVLGNMNDAEAPGYAEFSFGGKKHKLYPTAEDDKLFFVMRDATSGKSTYASARFLYADAAKNGKVTLDFNKAVNPPCAFTAYATCPKAPKENILAIPIEAGELPPEKLPTKSGV